MPSDAARNGLPAQPTPLVGRNDDLAVVCGQLVSDGVRLLTLTGPGGVGKTRLAVAAAEELVGHPMFPDGVGFVDLSPLQEPDLLLATLRDAFGVLESDGRPALDALLSFLAERRLLLALDNCEHLLPAVPEIGRLLAGAPGLTVLATSREPLRLRWERTLPLGPLALPDPHPRHLLPLDELARVPAVALFLERARAARPGFQLTAENAAATAQLVVRLDGLPLAIEIAAARAALLGPAALLARLDQHLPLPGPGSPDAPERHRTLQAAIGWSHDLLAADEQALFRTLAVFAGGWSLDGAETVVRSSSAATGQAALPDVLAGLMSLADKSLMQVLVLPDGEPWFRMLETVREFARGRLEESGTADAAWRGHADYYLQLAVDADPGLKGPHQRAWVTRLDREHDNLRAALRWLIGLPDAEAGQRLAGLLGYYWWIGGHLAEGRRWLAEARALDPQGAAPSHTAALGWSAILAYGQGDSHEAEELAASVLTQARERRAQAFEALALTLQGLVAWRRGELDEAVRLHRQALGPAREAGDPWLLGDLLYHLAMAESERNAAAAVEPLREARDLLRGVGGAHHLLLVIGTLADALARLGHDHEARALFQEGLAISRAADDPITAAWMATFALAFLAERGRADRAVPLLGALETATAAVGYRATPLEQAAYERARAAATSRLGEAAAATAWASLLVTSLADAVSAAAALLNEDLPDGAVTVQPRQRRTGRGLLSAREQEVLALVAAGRSNREIAEVLVVTENTAKYHVASLLNKLGAGTRAEAVTRAVALGLLSPGDQ